MITTKRRIEYAPSFLVLGMISEASEEIDAIPDDEWPDDVALLRNEIEARNFSGHRSQSPEIANVRSRRRA